MQRFFPSVLKYSDTIFCDNAGGSQIPYQVIKQVQNYVKENYVQPYSYNKISKSATDKLNSINSIVSTILNNKNGDIVYNTSSSQSLYLLANSLYDDWNNDTNLDKNIILSSFSHESATTPFMVIANNTNTKIKFWNLGPDYSINYNDLIEQVDSSTKLVVIPHVSNILGNVIDLQSLIHDIKKINQSTQVLVDGVAYMPHGLIDVDKYNVDYYVVSFYKFLGLRISAMYIKSGILCNLSNQNHYIFSDDMYNNSPSKLQVGGINYEIASSILGVKDYLIDYYKKIKSISNEECILFTREIVTCVMEHINTYEMTLTNKMNQLISCNDEITIIQDNRKAKIPIFSLTFKNYNIDNVNLVLNNLNIISKTGKFYCNRLFDMLNIKDGVLRISLMHYNTLDQVYDIASSINMFKYINNSKFNFKSSYILKPPYNDKRYYELQTTFNNLSIDKYYENTRYRGFSMLNVENIDNIEIIGQLEFLQSSNYNTYNGNITRSYTNISPDVLNNHYFKKMLKEFIHDYNNIQNIDSTYIRYVNVHQIRVLIDNKTNTVVPEGIHRDGFNIIKVCVISRYNITGGNSNIYNNKNQLLYTKCLEEGETITINDRLLFHSVDDISVIDEYDIAYRDVFVFTSID